MRTIFEAFGPAPSSFESAPMASLLMKDDVCPAAVMPVMPVMIRLPPLGACARGRGSMGVPPRIMPCYSTWRWEQTSAAVKSAPWWVLPRAWRLKLEAAEDRRMARLRSARCDGLKVCRKAKGGDKETGMGWSTPGGRVPGGGSEATGLA